MSLQSAKLLGYPIIVEGKPLLVDVPKIASPAMRASIVPLARSMRRAKLPNQAVRNIISKHLSLMNL